MYNQHELVGITEKKHFCSDFPRKFICKQSNTRDHIRALKPSKKLKLIDFYQQNLVLIILVMLRL